jgi:hypothetical protein
MEKSTTRLQYAAQKESIPLFKQIQFFIDVIGSTCEEFDGHFYWWRTLYEMKFSLSWKALHCGLLEPASLKRWYTCYTIDDHNLNGRVGGSFLHDKISALKRIRRYISKQRRYLASWRVTPKTVLYEVVKLTSRATSKIAKFVLHERVAATVSHYWSQKSDR